MEQKLKLPIMTKICRGVDLEKRIFREVLQDGPIGGYTFADGSKAKIYQCGECGQICEFNSTYSKHRKEAHGLEGAMFGWADGEPKWECLTEQIDESLILRAKK